MGRTFLHYLAVLFGRQLPQTQTTRAERDMLCSFLPGRTRIVEVGVFEGFTTRVLAESCDHDARIWGVDPFFTGRLGVSWGERIATGYNRQHLASGRLALVRTLSTEVGNEVPSSVDFIFIDADHSLAATTSDWAFWSERLERGGIIALHDTLPEPGNPDKPEFGSHQYFRSHIQHDRRFLIVGQTDSLSVLKKL